MGTDDAPSPDKSGSSSSTCCPPQCCPPPSRPPPKVSSAATPSLRRVGSEDAHRGEAKGWRCLGFGRRERRQEPWCSPVPQGTSKKPRAFAPPTHLSPLPPCLGLSGSITRPAGAVGVCWVMFEHNLGHGESKSEELLLVQEEGLTLSCWALAARPSPPRAGLLQEMLSSLSRSGGISTAHHFFFFDI